MSVLKSFLAPILTAAACGGALAYGLGAGAPVAIAQTETCNQQICGTSCRTTALPRHCTEGSGGWCSYDICDES